VRWDGERATDGMRVAVMNYSSSEEGGNVGGSGVTHSLWSRDRTVKSKTYLHMIAQLSSAILYVEPSTGEYFIGSPSRYVIHLTYAVCVCLHHQQQAERTGQD
jgi:hypothetical protein